MSISRMFKVGILCVAAGPLLSIAADRSDEAGHAAKLDSSEFVKKAGEAGAAEVVMGKMGASKATSAHVKAFAQRMVTDHTKANKELATTASAKGIEVPTSPSMMHKAMGEKMEHQSAGQEFDRDFMKQMVKDHEAAVELFSSATQAQQLDPELRALAKKTLPTLRQHLDDAQALQAKLGK